MDASNITVAVRDLSTALAPFGALAIFAALLWVIYRTGSGHVVRRRIWRLIHGKQEIPDQSIKTFVDEQTSLMAFRFESALRIRTIKRAQYLATWLKDNDEDISTVRRCGPYFDYEECGLNDPLPKKKLLLPLAAATALLAGLTLLPLRGAVDHRAFLQIKKSGTWFLITPELDRALRWKTWPFAKPATPLLPSMCTTDLTSVLQSTQLAADDATVICDLLKDVNAKEFVAASLSTQRIALTILTLLLAILSIAPFRRLMQIEAAHSISARLRKRSLQRDLDFGTQLQPPK